MIIQCEQCKTRFKLDESRVKETGVKVRCSKCKHTFIVKKEVPEEESDFDTMLQSFGGSPSDENIDTGTSASASTTVLPSYQRDEDSVIAVDTEPCSEACKNESRVEIESGSKVDELQSEAASDVTSEFIHAAEPRELDDYHFGDSFPSEQSGMESTFATDMIASHPESNREIQHSEEVLGSRVKAEKEFAEFFADSEKAENLKSGFGEIGKDSFAAGNTSPDVESPVIAVANDGERCIKDGNEFSATSAICGGHGEEARPFGDFAGVEEDELPPLSIASRRKGASVVPVTMIAVILTIVFVLAGTGYFLFNGYSVESVLQGYGLANLFGSDKTTGGKLTVKNIEGSYLVNNEIGEIFVVKGEVFNNSKPTGNTLQVKGLVYGPKGKVLAEQIVNCGNVLSNEQLMVFSKVAIEKSLNPSNGSSRVNQVLQSGKGIPFLIVFKNVPQGAEEFGVEVLGSRDVSQ